MQGLIPFLIVALVMILIGILIGTFINQQLVKGKVRSAESRVREILIEAESRRKEIEIEAKEGAIRMRDDLEMEVRHRQRELQRQDERLQRRQEQLDHRLENIDNRERTLNKRQSNIDKRTNELEEMEKQRIEELERISAMTTEEAKQFLLAAVEQEARGDMAQVLRQVEEEVKAKADEQAREIITLAIQRIASDQVAETTVSAVLLPSDDMKGRIIGRQGRNIRAFEGATGIDVIVDDTPEAIILSGYDPVRREVARVAMSKLITDGRIHPAHIEKVVEKARAEVEQIIVEEGERACVEVGIHGMHPNLIKLLGRLKFRTSYGQNQLHHSIEAAQIAGILAAELGADVRIAKEGALLHDIGKAIDHEVEGPHAIIGADMAKRCGVHPKVLNCIASHHHEADQECIEAIIAEVADAISGARPGARRESLESYIKRLKALEEIANSFPGVEESFAIQAGREIRIIVRPGDVDDYEAIKMSKEIARKLEENLEYPGQIKVTVIRETRAVDYAK